MKVQQISDGGEVRCDPEEAHGSQTCAANPEPGVPISIAMTRYPFYPNSQWTLESGGQTRRGPWLLTVLGFPPDMLVGL